jgi:hypothetical protein
MQKVDRPTTRRALLAAAAGGAAALAAQAVAPVTASAVNGGRGVAGQGERRGRADVHPRR